MWIKLFFSRKVYCLSLKMGLKIKNEIVLRIYLPYLFIVIYLQLILFKGN